MQDKYQEVMIMLVAGMTVFLTLTGIVVFVLLFYQKKKFNHRQQIADLQNVFHQEILHAQLETQEYTFRQVSEEIHDNVGQLLSTVNMLLGITERNLEKPPETLSLAMTTVARAIHDLRGFSKSLSTEWLNQFDLLENIRNELDRLSSAGIVQGQLQTDIAVLPYLPQEQVMLFRVLQEAIQNCIRHSGATSIQVSVRTGESEIYLDLEDNGKGFDPAAMEMKGIGMMNMRHRIGLMHGSIVWESVPSVGTKVGIRLPIKMKI